jgi:hypothetical protein
LGLRNKIKQEDDGNNIYFGDQINKVWLGVVRSTHRKDKEAVKGST